MKALILLSIISLFLFPCISVANDGYSAVGVGGIELSKTDDIAINSEILDISVDEIKVTYEFINESNKDIDSTIMFPLPAYWADPRPDAIRSVPPNFSIKVNGKAVKYKTQVKAIDVNNDKPYKPSQIPEGKDITTILKNIGFTDKQIAMMPFDMNDTVSSKPGWPITKTQMKVLTKENLVKHASGDQSDILSPTWAIVISYIWEQKFPANSSIKVEHSYTPFVAGGSKTGFSDNETETEELKSTYCLSDNQLKDLKLLLPLLGFNHFYKFTPNLSLRKGR